MYSDFIFTKQMFPLRGTRVLWRSGKIEDFRAHGLHDVRHTVTSCITACDVTRHYVIAMYFEVSFTDIRKTKYILQLLCIFVEKVTQLRNDMSRAIHT